MLANVTVTKMSAREEGQSVSFFSPLQKLTLVQEVYKL